MKRLGIFSFTDRDGIVDDYVIYLLNDISQNLDELCIISKDELSPESLEKLRKTTDRDVLFKKDNKFDVESWRDVMTEFYGFEKLLDFDEIVLFNNSFFGPLYPFETVFSQMENKNLDFWGITSHGEMPNVKDLCPYETCPPFIQNYFLVIGKRMFQTREFEEYWMNLSRFKNQTEVKYKHEAVFTRYFEDLGFKWGALVNCDNMGDIDTSMDFYLFDTCNLVKNKGLPVLDVKSFTKPRKKHLEYNMSLDLSNTFEYVKSNTDYEVSLIYEHLTRVIDPHRIVENLNLIRIFQKNQQIDFETDKKILVIAHLYYEDLLEYDLEYLKNIPDFVDVLITCNTSQKKKFFEEKIAAELNNSIKVIKVDNRGRDMSALLIGARDIVENYDYFCFIHDKKSSTKEYVTVGLSFRDILWENILASENYIAFIIKEFDDNPNLGLILPPKVYHGTYFNGYVNNYWIVNYDNTVKLLEEMGIDTPIERNCPPLSIGNCFWARYDALKPIFESYWRHGDFPKEPLPGDGTVSHAIERVYGYIAASRGYYSEYVMTEEYARAEMTNFNYMASQTLNVLHKKMNPALFNQAFSGFDNSLRKMRQWR